LTQNLPDHLKQYQTRDIAVAALANLGSSMPPHISIENNRFTLIDAANNEIPVPTFDPQTGPYLDAAIIDVADVMSRIYFADNYDKKAEGKRPDCFSDNGIGPSTASSNPQAPTCAACPRSEWTKINANGNKVPWCTHKYKIALLIPGFDTLFLLAVPPNSHGPLREYLATCKGNGINPANLVTRLWFVSQGTLGFVPRPGGPAMAYIDATVAQLRERAYAEKKTDALVGRLDMARPAGTIAQQPVQQIGAQMQTTQPSPHSGGAPFAAAVQQVAQQQFSGQGFAMQHADPLQGYVPQGTSQWPQQGATQQVQQPGPFGEPLPVQSPVQNAGWPGPTNQPAPTVATKYPSEQPTTVRRKRRTHAEIAAANGGGQPAGAQQAPFPHPGQQTVPFGGGGSATAPTTSAAGGTQLEFGIAQGQDAGANPELAGMLDKFFTGGPA
jgi:hypothetical protein